MRVYVPVLSNCLNIDLRSLIGFCEEGYFNKQYVIGACHQIEIDLNDDCKGRKTDKRIMQVSSSLCVGKVKNIAKNSYGDTQFTIESLIDVEIYEEDIILEDRTLEIDQWIEITAPANLFYEVDCVSSGRCIRPVDP